MVGQGEETICIHAILIIYDVNVMMVMRMIMMIMAVMMMIILYISDDDDDDVRQYCHHYEFEKSKCYFPPI